MGYISAQQTRYSHLISGFLMIAILLVSAGSADAGTFITQCNDCHGMPPKDGASRKGNPHFRSYSAATVGNHTTHLSPSPVANDCVVCHGTAVSAISTATHQNDVINMAAASAIKGGSYTKGVFFNQTSIPVLTAATCSTVGCHFETITPAWGSAVLVSTADCGACHLASPISLSHQKHTVTYSFACTACHTDHSGEAKPFAHATSVGRPISVPVGNYSGSNDRYLPSLATGRVLGSCTTAYCHSTVQAATGLGNGTGQSVTWGGAVLSCGGCHQNMATDSAGTGTGSHPLHATATTSANGTGVNYTCQVCHGTLYSRTKTPAGGTHVNNAINLSFTTISGATAAGTVYAKGTAITPGSAIYGRCSTSACHGAGTPVWGANTALPECFKCHGSTAGTYANTSSATIAPGGGTSGRDTGGNTLATSPRVGAHQSHLTASLGYSAPIHCGECHTTHLTVKDATHLNFTTATIAFGPLAKSGSLTPGVSRTAGVMSCSNTYCHGASMTSNTSNPPASRISPPFWNAPFPGAALAVGNGSTTPGTGNCSSCHAYPPMTATHAGKAATACAGCHSHVNPTGTGFTDASLHINGTVNATGGHSYPYPGATHMTAAGVSPWNCSCHSTTAVGNNSTYSSWVASGAVGARTAPDCTVCHLGGLKTPDTVVTTSSCWDCHGASATDGMPNGAAFPNLAGSHTAHVVGKGMACVRCHNGAGSGTANHGNSGGVTRATADVTVASATSEFVFAWAGGTGKGSCSSNACHINAEWGVTQIDCVGCHTSTQLIANGPLANGSNVRRAVAADLKFSGSRNHKSTAIGLDATKWDCIVCHMEGNYASGSSDAAYHGNGVLDFRDPDTGTQVLKVKWNGLPYAANLLDAGGRYVSTLTNFTTARFARNLSETLESDTSNGAAGNTWLRIASIQMNLCLKCHDYNGAKNSTAWTKNAAGTVIGSAGQPFGLPVGNSSRQYVVSNDATGNSTLYSAAGNTTGNVMNVFSQLSSANASTHPVIARGNNGFSKGTNMKAPWSTGTNTPRASTTVYGYLISCFDCHSASGAAGNTTVTVVAHGNGSGNTATASALRSPYPSLLAVSGGTTNLCTVCHADLYTLTSQHGTTSAFQTGSSSMDATTMGLCTNCHVTTTNSVSARAVAVHGYNATEAGSITFPTTNSRPYAFWRGGASVTYWGPGSCSVSCTTRSYTTQGVY